MSNTKSNKQRSAQLVKDVKEGRMPEICGTFLTEEEVLEIRNILIQRKVNIDTYFNEKIRTRLDKSKSRSDWNDLKMK